MNISGTNLRTAGGGLFGRQTGLKSTQEKQERQQKMQSQVDFYEKQKANLGEWKCDSVEEIARKLDLLHSYEDEITAVKAAYNQEQMFHVLDEARERGEQIAEAAKKSSYKTPEERKKEAAEEAAGENGDGLLDELLEASEEALELEELEALEELEEEAAEEAGSQVLTETDAAGEKAEEAMEAAEEAGGQVLTETDAAGEKAEAAMKAAEEAGHRRQEMEVTRVQEERMRAERTEREWVMYPPFDVRG